MSESTTVLVTEEAITVIGTVPIGPQGPPGVVTASDVVDLFTGTPDGTTFLRDDGTLATPAGGGSGAPVGATYLVTTAHVDLTAEEVVGLTPGGELGGTWAVPTVDALHSGSTHADVQAAAEATAAADATTKVAAEAVLARNADNLTSGTVADARIPAAIARDAEVAAAYQPLDSDLTAIAALVPANDDIVQRKLGAWTNRTIAQLLTDLAAPGTTFQPLDSDLTAIAALTTTAFGRGLLALADAAALRTSAGLVLGTDIYSKAAVDAGFQPLDSDLTAIAALATTATGRSLLAAADAAAIRAITGSVGLTGNETVAGIKTFSSEPSAPTYKATGNTGALTTPITLTGANATGAPTTGAHVKGEVAGDDTGKLWYCTVAGTPGTWVQIGGGGGVSDGDKGDITVTSSGTVWTIDNDAVTLSKLANIATSRILGRVTAASGDPEELTAAQVKTLLAILADWSALGNLGATETVTGIDDTIVRSAGTLDQACTVTITTTADQTIDLQLTQDATGGRAVTWSGVNVWRTQDGTAPVLTIRPAGAVDRFFFENIAGTCYGTWLTESPIEAFSYAIGDESTAITTGNGKITFRAPFAFTLVAVRASLTTASTSGIPTFDINEAGVTLLSTKLTIDATEKTSTTAATAAVISDNVVADDAEMSIDVDVAGTAAAGAKITLYVRRR